MLSAEDGTICATPAQLLGRWIQFFGDMEGGTRLDQQQQWTRWRRNLEQFQQPSLQLSVAAVPTLIQVLRLLSEEYPSTKPAC